MSLRGALAAVCVLVSTALALGACGGGSSTRSLRAVGAKTPPGVRAVRSRHSVADYDSDEYEARSDADDDDSSPPYDRDGDSDSRSGGFYDEDDTYVVDVGHAARPADRQAVQAVVARYFAAVAALNGRLACSLMLASVAGNVPEALGGAVKPPYAHGHSCSQIAASVFAFYHRQLVAEADTLQLEAVRVHGTSALAVLTFKRRSGLPPRLIALAREHGAWKIDGLLDNELP